MTSNIARPVNLDLSSPGNSNFRAPSQDKFDTQPGNDHSRHSGAQKDQQLQEDAARLRELLKAEAPAVTANVPEPKIGPLSAQDLSARNPSVCDDGREPKLHQDPERPGPESAEGLQAEPENHRLTLPSHAAAKFQEPFEHAQDHSRGEDVNEAIRPFELFSHATPSSLEPTATTETPELKKLDEGLLRLARTLLVSESAQGSQSIRMELTAEHFPGVVLEVFKDEGAIVAQFVCANEHSRTNLARAARWMGESLSANLKRNTLVRVLTDDPEDPSPVEARHHA